MINNFKELVNGLYLLESKHGLNYSECKEILPTLNHCINIKSHFPRKSKIARHS